MTPNDASLLIDYLEVLEERTNHQQIMERLEEERGITEQELDAAAKKLGELAGRDYGML